MHAVEEDAVLTCVATAYAQDLIACDCLSHTRGEGSTPEQRAAADGHDSTFMGEVLARGTDSEQLVRVGWNGSPRHRDIIVTPEAEEFELGRFSTTWVLMLGAEAP